jgi:hypothetical protein
MSNSSSAGTVSVVELPTSPQGSTVPDATGERISASTAWSYRVYQSRIADMPEVCTWVQIDLGSTQPIDAVRLYPSNEVYMPGNGFPLRFRIECSDHVDFHRSELIADRCSADYPDPADQVVQFSAREVHGRYVRLTALKLREKKRPNLPVELPGSNGPAFLLSLSKIAVLSNGQDIAVHRRVSADRALGSEDDAQQLTRAPRPQGEGMITDERANVTSPSSWRPVGYKARPPMQGVQLHGGLFQAAMENNIDYLLDSFSNSDLLRQFRVRAGTPIPESARKPHPFWEEGLGGSNAGRFLMGAGNTLRWMEHAQLRTRMNGVVDGIAECRQPNGYMMGYPEDSIFVSESEPYARSWTTHGLIEAGYAGNPTAFELLRGYYDWYNQTEYLPELLRRCAQGGQGMVANTRIYFTPVGKPADIQVVQRYFQENYWLDDLANRRPEAIWQYPYDRPHCYLLTNLEANLDLYRATGHPRYLQAVDGGWDLYHENWENIGGSISIIETERNEPKSNKVCACLGETCGSAFWMLLNQRLHCLRPDEERYVCEMEKSIYNVLLANQDGALGIRYHTLLAGHKGPARRINTCCEGQGTRIIGSLPEYIYSIAPDGLYINLYEPSSIVWPHAGEIIRVAMHTAFPRDGAVEIEIETPARREAKLHIRIPSWAASVIDLKVNGKQVATGAPGTYVTLERIWQAGDRISFVLPMTLKLTKYTGADQIAGHERFALEYGPLLMAAMGAAERELPLFLATGRPTDLIGRLRPDKEHACHFVLFGSIEMIGSEVSFIPYFEVANQSFSCFPIIKSRAGIFW